MTLGELKLRLTQQFPGISLDLIEGWISDTYQSILGELSWSRQDVQGMLLLTAPYSTGTVAVTLGSASVVGTGTTWTAAMTGRMFRVPGQDARYEFTYASATTGTIDRVYEGPTAATAGYVISQSVYPMPADCRLLPDDAFNTSLGGLTRVSHAQLNDSAPTRSATGQPMYWASYMDSGSTPPRMQVEIYPVPDATSAVGLPFSYAAESTSPTDTSTILQIWLQPAALFQGVVALALRHQKDYTGAQLALVAAASALKTMRAVEARRMGPAQMQLDSYYTSHRSKRWCR